LEPQLTGLTRIGPQQGVACNDVRTLDKKTPDMVVSPLADAKQILLAPEEYSLGVKPRLAAKALPFLNWVALPTCATTAVAVSGPTPGISWSRLQASLFLANAVILDSYLTIAASQSTSSA
jgi:hypothetical protein